MNEFPIRPEDPMRQQALHAVLDYMLKAAKQLRTLPRFGFAVAADTRVGAVTMGQVPDLASVPAMLQNMTVARDLVQQEGSAPVPVCADVVVLAYPFVVRSILGDALPRVAVIVAEPHVAPTLDVYRVDLNPLAPGIFREGSLVDISPAHVQNLTLWGVTYPATPPSSGLLLM